MQKNRGKVVPLQPSKAHSVRKPLVVVAGLFMPAWTLLRRAEDETIRDSRLETRDSRRGCTMFRWVNGPRLLEKLPVAGKNTCIEGWGIYRCLVGTVITDPISRSSMGKEAAVVSL